MRQSGHLRLMMEAREEFLATGATGKPVRATTLRSWARSMAAGVPATGTLEPPFAGDIDGDAALLRAARPVAMRLFEHMPEAPVAMLVTDDQARVLGRWGSDSQLISSLDAISGRPGFNFAESIVGTSALGTPLEEGGPTIVEGYEHFSETLGSFSAVGTPILHPVTGRTEGVIDLVCSDSEASKLMLPLVMHTAQDISTGLLTGYASDDRALLDGFLRYERRGPRRPMLAINSRMLMCNPLAADLVPASDHGRIWQQIQRALRSHAHEIVVVSGDDGAVRGALVEIHNAGDPVGVVVHLRRAEASRDGAGTRPPIARSRDLAERLPGDSAVWTATRQRAHELAANRQSVLFVGPAGAGKRALAIAATEAVGPIQSIAEHDGRHISRSGADLWLAEVMHSLAAKSATVVLTHLDELDERVLARLCRHLDNRAPGDGRVMLTYATSDTRSELPGVLRTHFPNIISVPALEERAEDIPAIASLIACESWGHEPARVDPAAARQLMDQEWPENVRQLRKVVQTARATCPGTVIRVDDLPALAPMRSLHRKLSPLERVERDAIIAALKAANHNKLVASRQLGIARSTLYRKLAVLGVDG